MLQADFNTKTGGCPRKQFSFVFSVYRFTTRYDDAGIEGDATAMATRVSP